MESHFLHFSSTLIAVFWSFIWVFPWIDPKGEAWVTGLRQVLQSSVCSNKINGLLCKNKVNVFAFYSGEHKEDQACSSISGYLFWDPWVHNHDPIDQELHWLLGGIRCGGRAASSREAPRNSAERSVRSLEGVLATPLEERASVNFLISVGTEF